MNEELLSHFWRLQRFRRETLCTTDGEIIQVVYPGLQNPDSGPDFLHARIKIGNTLWAGNVELHTRSSDWLKHGHQNDPAYGNIILHVVYESDVNLNLNCPELELRHFIEPEPLSMFKAWSESIEPIPCHNLLKVNPEALKPWWMERMLIERLENKSRRIEALVQELNRDWEAAFYLCLGHYFGLRVNVLPFEMTIRSLPVNAINRFRNHREEMEALLFGQAGMLSGGGDGFKSSLTARYRLQQSMYQIEPIPGARWKFSRLRPAGFPTVRLSQFADFLCKNKRPLTALLECESISEMTRLFDIEAHEYWSEHSQFGQVARKIPIQLGRSTQELIIGNAVLPFLFVYATHWSLPDKKEWIIDAFRELEKEDNKITRTWEAVGIEMKNFAETQSILQLHTHYCAHKKCLQCETGLNLMKTGAMISKL